MYGNRRTEQEASQSQSGLENLAADRLEKEVNSVLEASEATGSGKRLLVGSVAIILVLAAGLLIWQSRNSRSSEQPSEEPAVICRQVRWTRHPRPGLHLQRPVFLSCNLDLLKQLQPIQTPVVMKGIQLFGVGTRSPQLPPRLPQRRAFRSPSLKTPRNFKECPPPHCPFKSDAGSHSGHSNPPVSTAACSASFAPQSRIQCCEAGCS